MSVRRFRNFRGATEEGQALIIFAVALVSLLGFVGLSVDVGRFMWAKSEMQSNVDAAALAGAQSMPEGTTQAKTFATQFWNSNKSTIIANGKNVTFDVTFPGGNRAVKVEAKAEIPTYFVHFFGVDHWDVSATGKAESQVLDIALVLDVSGSMCFTSYPPVEGSGPSGTYAWKGVVMGPGRADPYSSYTFPKLREAVPAGGSNTITIKVNDVGVFETENSTARGNLFGSYFQSSGKKYHEISPNGGRSGMIMIDDELMRITGISTSNDTLTVTRAQTRYDTGETTTKAYHAVGAEIWTNKSSYGSRDYCDMASKYARTSTTDGPHQPFDGALDKASYFIGLFNPAYDKIGLAHYSSGATRDAWLTGTSFSTLYSTINGLDYPTGGTNIADGIAKGRQIINGTGKRANGVKIIVILTDGVPTNYCSGDSTSINYGQSSCSEQSSSNINSCTTTTAVTHAINQAAVAKGQDMIVYTIGLGDAALDCILEDIAEAGGGEYYKAPTTEQLDEAFEEIAKKTHIGLTN